jgi:hypothetical protein
MKRILLLLKFSLVYNAYGQNECNLDKLPGEWKYINLIHWGVHTNVDSLKAISLSYKPDGYSIYEFFNDSTFTIRPKTKSNDKIYKGYYSVDKNKCELIIGRKKKDLKNNKYRTRHNWVIIYIDDEILIYVEDNNPKGIATHVLIK